MNILSLLASHPALVLSGFGLGLSLIVAIGAQNAYVLRQGARREHLLAVLLVCILSDVTLILAGVVGLGTVIEHAPWVVSVMRWLGVAFLVGYGLLAARRAWNPTSGGLKVDDADGDEAVPERSGATVAAGSAVEGTAIAGTVVESTARTVTVTLTKASTHRLLPVVLTTLALTWLNPHVYLDTVILLGSVANTHGADGRWAFAVGACLGSIAWFAALGYGSRLLSRWLSSPLAWRILDGVIAAIMLTLAASLALSS
ncbi:LysE/ArgO family amino acid transporter [Homoserinimonas sp. A447]